jgi:peptidoglycan/LPS O-acetylase OafA/YrhL
MVPAEFENGRAFSPVDESIPTQVWRPDIQGLRAVAVILVILSHAYFPGLSGGFIGVDVFFVISGFVITQNLHRLSDGSLGAALVTFYSRRIRRIVPAASVALVVTLFAAYVVLGRTWFNPALLGDVRWASLFSANSRFISTGVAYLGAGQSSSLVVHFWSLAVEEQFYFVWPLVFLGLSQFVPRERRLDVIRISLVVIIVASVVWSIYATSVNELSAYFSPLTRAYEIALGALVALRPMTWKWSSRLNDAVAFSGAGLIGLSLLLLHSPNAFPGAVALIPCAGATLLLLAGDHEDFPLVGRLLSVRPLQFVGNISFPLYLYHFAFLNIPLALPNPWTGWAVRTGEIALALACAVASDRFVERPVRHSRRLDRDPIAVSVLLVVCILVVWNSTWIVAYLGNFTS